MRVPYAQFIYSAELLRRVISGISLFFASLRGAIRVGDLTPYFELDADQVLRPAGWKGCTFHELHKIALFERTAALGKIKGRVCRSPFI